MRAVVLFGGPRKNGNTMKLTERFMDGLKSSGCEIDFIDAANLKVSSCTGCLYCEKYGNCVINDEMQNIYDKIDNSNIIVLSSPIYFASVTSQLKAVIDRFQTLYSRRYVLKTDNNIKRDGYLIFTAGGKNEKMIDAITLTAKYFMLSCSASLKDVVYALGTDEEPVEKKPFILETAYEKGLIAGRG